MTIHWAGGGGASSSSSRRATPANTPSADLWPPHCEKVNFCGLSYQARGILLLS